MAKAFSVLSWNVEHFGATNKGKDKPTKPVAPIIDLIVAQNADVVAIYEVVGKTVFSEVVSKMPDYHFHITEGPQTQEILIGVRKNFSSFFTQKTEFKSGVTALRPGALLTLTIDEQQYPLLFLHLKSLSDPRGFGLRDDMIQRAIDFRKILNKADKKLGGDGQSNFLALGDLNTMGMNLTYSTKDISGEEEIKRLEERLAHRSVAMKILNKQHPATYLPSEKSRYAPGNLDHVIAAEHLVFKQFNGFPVDVRGWVDEPTPAKQQSWAEKYSDHAMLYFEVQKP